MDVPEIIITCCSVLLLLLTLPVSSADSDIIPTMRGDGNDLDFGSSYRLSVENDWTNGLTSRSVCFANLLSQSSVFSPLRSCR